MAPTLLLIHTGRGGGRAPRLGKVAYHLPCHLKAQNIGFRSRQLLAIAGAEVEMLENCSGLDGGSRPR